MLNINPLLLVGGVIGAVTALLIFAYASVKDKKTAMGFERTMADGEILRRLFAYAKPYWAKFLLVLFLMLFSIAYDIISPLIVGAIEELVAADFTLSRLFASVAVYAGVLVFSMASTYFQAVILQRVGQRIISDLREDLFTHIESLSHEQLNEIPVGKLVTRVTNDTNAISMMFTNLLVNLIKNAFVILGILVAMLCLNYALTLMVLCFVPFIVIFTVIFRKFSRRAYRELGVVALLDFAVDKFSPVHGLDLAHQVGGVGVSLGVGDEAGFVLPLVSPQRQHVVQPQEIHVDQRILDVVFRPAAADQVGNHLHVVFAPDRGRDTDRARTAAHDVPLAASVGADVLFEGFAVEGDVDVGRVEIHQRVDGSEDAARAVPLQGRKQLEGETGRARSDSALYEIRNIHQMLLGISFSIVSVSMSRRAE